ncbi:MAG: GxxExxY protein [Verrucomicrobiota bacterium]
MDLNQIGTEIIDAAIAVHRELGPGLLESAYESCLAFELTKRGLTVERQKEQPILYQTHLVETGYRLDLLVENEVIVELKSVDSLQPIHQAQLITYLKLANKKLGYLLNFNVRLLKNGIKRIKL